mgnify:CR=1 FL=1
MPIGGPTIGMGHFIRTLALAEMLKDDVLERFMPTIHQLKPDHIVCLTGDCPLVSIELGEQTIVRHIASGKDETFTLSKVALGTACEIYKTEAVLKLKKLINITNHSEYLIY